MRQLGQLLIESVLDTLLDETSRGVQHSIEIGEARTHCGRNRLVYVLKRRRNQVTH